MIQTKLLTNNFLNKERFEFLKINSIYDYNHEECVLVNLLSPDYSMLLNGVKLIITKTGSKLSHLSILANEYKVTILKIEDKEFDRLPIEGEIYFNKDGLTIKIQ